MIARLLKMVLLLKILKEMPQTMLLASMDFNLVSELADRVLLLDRGLVVAMGSPADILSDRVLMEEHGLINFPPKN